MLEALEQKGSLEDRYKRMSSLMVEKRSETLAAAGKAQIELNQITEATRVLQRQVRCS